MGAIAQLDHVMSACRMADWVLRCRLPYLSCMECSAAGVIVVTDHHKGGQLKVENGVALLESTPHSQLG